MPIEFQSPKFAKLYGQAAILYGSAIKAKQEYETAKEIASKLHNVELQQEMETFNYNLALEKMKFAELLDFEKEKRAETWELEKAELRSKLDFNIAEKKRLKNQEDFELGMKYINEKIADKTIPAEKRGELEFNLYMKKIMDENIELYEPIEKKETDVIDQLLTQQLGGAVKSPALQLGQSIIPQATPTYSIGQIINRGGKNYKIAGFDVDGTPLVNPV